MKKLAVVLMVSCVAIFAAGCSLSTEEDRLEYKSSVIMLIQFDLSSETIGQSAFPNLKTYLDDLVEPYEMQATPFHVGSVLQIELYFENYKAFLKFNDMFGEEDDLIIVDYELERKLFYIERTIRFENPWRTLHVNEKMDKIEGDGGINFMVRQGGFHLASAEPDYFYIFETDSRRSRVADAFITENLITGYEYYFYGSGDNMVDEIIIFDRFANQSAWYIAALIATIVSMIIVYLLLRLTNKGKPKSTWISCENPNTGLN